MLVYRLESKAEIGRGIFTAGIADGLPDPYRDQVYSHPGPYSDRGLAPWWRDQNYLTTSQFYFGCASMDQLRATFRAGEAHPLWGVLDAEGAILAVYEVPDQDVLWGECQCVFRMERARLVERRPTSDQFVLPLQ